MTTSTSTIKTDYGSKYLQLMCKHFGHKVPVEFTEKTGSITLSFGNCMLVATTNELTLTAHAAPTDITRLERVIGDHLARFAFRENLKATWQRAA